MRVGPAGDAGLIDQAAALAGIGEAARRADFELFKARFRRGARFVNGYGLTEATAVLQGFSDHDTQPWGNVLSLGWPVGDQRVLLLDAQGQPAGVSGELVIESRHELVGQSFAGKVLVFPGAKGSSGWSVAFHTTRLKGVSPLAMVFNVMTTKAALGGLQVPSQPGQP